MNATRPPAQRPTGSLRLRFALAISLWVLLGVGAIWYSAVRVFTEHVELGYHEELEVHVRELARLTRIGADGQPELSRPLSDPRYEEPLSGFYWQVTLAGKRTLRSQSMTRGSLDEHVAHASRITHQTDNGPTGPAITYGLLRKAPDGEDIHFVIATDQAELDRVIGSFTRALTVWLAGLATVLLATGLGIIHFGMIPLNRLAEAGARLRSGKAQWLEGRYPTEIAPMVEDLNAHIEHNAGMIARARVQAGNIAHSLRTPLAVITDEAERLEQSGKAPGTAAVMLEQALKMENQIEYQLARVRSSAGRQAVGATSVLPDLLDPILSAMKRLHRDKSFTLDSAGEGPVVLPVDPVDLAELLSILLDNAGKWAREQVQVRIVQRAGGGVEIAIRDDGRGMSEAEIARAFELGSRFDDSVPGSGLGLAIAHDIAGSLGAKLTLEPALPGLRAIVRFPAECARNAPERS
ncbi:MAG: HAMP domain-containing histidine kinase [Sphingomonadales bacterium]|nr:HAMP domain-containing histidine kinase [Sphingomonadales bacterium]MBD3775118.1 HAMP domain-containing histidine kinase [Paracoccaceae bacterium]